MMQRQRTAWIAAGMAVATSSLSSGAITTFDDRDGFEIAAGTDLIIESFENRAAGELSLPYVLPGSGFGIDVMPMETYGAFITDTPVFSIPSDGTNNLSFVFGQGTYQPVFTMPDASIAFGFDLSGYQDLDGSGTFLIELLSGGALVDSIDVAAPIGATPGFLGLVSDQAFDEVRVTIEDGGLIGFGDFVGFDQLTVGFVPGPGGVALLVLAGLARNGRRRR